MSLLTLNDGLLKRQAGHPNSKHSRRHPPKRLAGEHPTFLGRWISRFLRAATLITTHVGRFLPAPPTYPKTLLQVSVAISMGAPPQPTRAEHGDMINREIPLDRLLSASLVTPPVEESLSMGMSEKLTLVMLLVKLLLRMSTSPSQDPVSNSAMLAS